VGSSTPNPAEAAAIATQKRVKECLDSGTSFVLEAGAGAGKTHSLGESLDYLLERRGKELVRARRRIACITYTNVATNEILTRTDRHPAIYCSTIHAFCWSLIRGFQPQLRVIVPTLESWAERLNEAGLKDVGSRLVDYSLGYPKIDQRQVLLHHHDVLQIAARLLEKEKFHAIVTSQYPVIFVDEYQDTDAVIADALKAHVLGQPGSPMIGFFGDHWQKIYDDGCGAIQHSALTTIGKGANFRSVPAIVQCLNRMRPSLPQEVKDPKAAGMVSIFHTNGWRGPRQTGSHTGGDLPSTEAAKALIMARTLLEKQGWDFSSAAKKTKILMLTHTALGVQQGYSGIVDAFKYNDSFLKKEDPYIAFLLDVVEPLCAAYEQKRTGQMFEILGDRLSPIRQHVDKQAWVDSMAQLLKARKAGTIGDVLDVLKKTRRPRLPDAVEAKEKLAAEPPAEFSESVARWIEQSGKLRAVPYQQVIALSNFIADQSSFATKHGVKGAQFENVLVVVGRGWNKYNFGQFLEWGHNPPADKVAAHERNRNLFYVCCSRPITNLAILFTQQLSARAMTTIEEWFNGAAIHEIELDAS
jgi:DNA helicase II / ATP-dependent DNA helicase PcrA